MSNSEKENKTSKKAPSKKNPVKKTASKKAVAKKPKKAEKAKEEVILNKEETANVDALIAADKAEREAPNSDASLDNEEHKVEEVDPVEQALKEAAASDAANQVKKDTENEAKKQAEFDKNVFVPLSAPTFEGDVCEEEVEKKRSFFSKTMKKTRRFSSITMLVLILGLIGGFVAYTYLPSDLKWITYVIFGVVLVFVIVAFILSSRLKKTMYGDIDVYVKDAFTIVDSYVFNDPEFKDVKLSKAGHIDVNDIGNAHYFDTINAVNSRNIVTLDFLDKKMTVSEVAARVPAQEEPLVLADEQRDVDLDGISSDTVAPEGVNPNEVEPEKKDEPKHSPLDKKNQPKEAYGIFGKFVTYPLALKENAGLIIVMKGTNTVFPTYLDSYSVLPVPALNSTFLVYTDDSSVANEVFQESDIVNVLNTFVTDENLENMFMCINPKGLRICLNYNETVMEVPMEKPVIGKPYVHYKNDIQKVKELIKALSK